MIDDDDNPETGLGAATGQETPHSSLGELAPSPDVEAAIEMSAVPPIVRKALDDVRLATGGFAMSSDSTDRMMRDLREGSALRDATAARILAHGMRGRHSSLTRVQAEAAGLIGGSTAKSLLRERDTGFASRAFEQAGIRTGSVASILGPSTLAALYEQSTGSGVLRAMREAKGARYATTDLFSSASSLRDEFGTGYANILREISGIGSLGGVAASLVAGRTADLDVVRGLFADVSSRSATAMSAAATSVALRNAHARLLPPLRSPMASELDGLMDATRRWPTLAAYPEWLGRARAGVSSLTEPWVREDRPDLSLEAMARFAHLGGTVANLDPRDAAVSQELRQRFGDYRPETEIREGDGDESAEDPTLRVAERYDRGFDPVLSSIPTRIVLAMLAPFGLRFDAEAVDDEFGIDDIAGQMLRRVERRLMEFVQKKLDDAWGDDWVAHVPGDVRYQLRRRHRQAEESGRPAAHLISYADFGSWIAIIGRGENWPLFVGAFGSLDVLRETLEQIRPIRHDTSHPRGVGPEDLLTLAVNGKRLLRWMA